MKITLAEARLILDNKENELAETFARRRDCQVNIYRIKDGKKELTHEEHEFSVDNLTDTADRLQREIRILRLICAKANVNTEVDFTVDGHKITLQEAVWLIKQYRDNLPSLKAMGELKTTSEIVNRSPRWVQQQNAVDNSYEQITEPNFNTKNYRKLAEKTAMLITKLEIAINQANYGTYVDVNGVELPQFDNSDKA